MIKIEEKYFDMLNSGGKIVKKMTKIGEKCIKIKKIDQNKYQYRPKVIKIVAKCPK